MGDVAVVGGGICGLATALLLARDGHRVRVLERDPALPPPDVDGAWQDWERGGVAQFRQAHNLHARARHVLAAELPDVLQALERAGALRWDPLSALPPFVTDREPRPGDDRFWTFTGRRPMLEKVFADAAEAEPGVEVVRGIRATGLAIGAEAVSGVPHVVGVRTDRGLLEADLVIDAMGRRSEIGRWLESVGGRPPYEEAEDCRFAYYTRFFRSRDGSRPALLAPVLTHFPTFSLLTLFSDNDTWSLTVFTSTTDPLHKRLRHVDVWTSVVLACPLHAHWIDADPLSDVLAMSGIADRYRRFVVEGRPVATGLLAVADAWACTNPSAGRGISVGLLHAVLLRDVVREHGGSPGVLGEAFDEATEAHVAPWYWQQVMMDRTRLAELEAAREGRPLRPDEDRRGELFTAVLTALPFDADAFRAFLEVLTCLALPDEIFARPGIADRVLAAAEGREPLALPGPGPDELLGLLAGTAARTG